MAGAAATAGIASLAGCARVGVALGAATAGVTEGAGGVAHFFLVRCYEDNDVDRYGWYGESA